MVKDWKWFGIYYLAACFMNTIIAFLCKWELWCIPIILVVGVLVFIPFRNKVI